MALLITEEEPLTRCRATFAVTATKQAAEVETNGQVDMQNTALYVEAASYSAAAAAATMSETRSAAEAVAPLAPDVRRRRLPSPATVAHPMPPLPVVPLAVQATVTPAKATAAREAVPQLSIAGMPPPPASTLLESAHSSGILSSSPPVPTRFHDPRLNCSRSDHLRARRPCFHSCPCPTPWQRQRQTRFSRDPPTDVARGPGTIPPPGGKILSGHDRRSPGLH